MKNLTFFLSVLFLSCSFINEARAFGSNTDERLDKIEEQLSIFEKEIYNKDLSFSDKTKEATANIRAMFEVRISNLEEQLRVLTGRLEEEEFANHRMHNKIDELNKELDAKLREIRELTQLVKQESDKKNDKIKVLEQSLKEAINKPPVVKIIEKVPVVAEKTPVPVSASTSTPSSSSAKTPDVDTDYLISIIKKGKPDIAEKQNTDGKGSAEKDYGEAFSLLENTKYKEAGKKFQQFIKNHSDHKLVENSYYWLGETFYIQDDFEKASVHFLQGYQKYPKGAKSPDNLLKLGMSLGRAGKKDEACTAFKKLKTDFSEIPAAISQRLEKENNLFECK